MLECKFGASIAHLRARRRPRQASSVATNSADSLNCFGLRCIVVGQCCYRSFSSAPTTTTRATATTTTKRNHIKPRSLYSFMSLVEQSQLRPFKSQRSLRELEFGANISNWIRLLRLASRYSRPSGRWIEQSRAVSPGGRKLGPDRRARSSLSAG